MLKINKKIISILLIPFVIYGLYTLHLNKQTTTVKAFGDLTVDFGVPTNDPIFTVTNMLPGDCEDRQIVVTNDGDDDAVVAIRSDNEIDDDSLSEVLTIEISNGQSLYFDTLKQFFIDSDYPDGIFLQNLTPGQEETYSVNICFDTSATEIYKNTSVTFDLIFGEIVSDISLPPECAHLAGAITETIEGTNGNDELKGTRANELILGLGGNDKIDGKGGDDCIVGAEGNDKLDGGTGRDIIVGGIGNDKLEGGTNNDKLYGGPGNDELFGDTGDDFLDGGEDRDYLKGGTGEDTCINGETVHKSCEF